MKEDCSNKISVQEKERREAKMWGVGEEEEQGKGHKGAP